MKYQVGDKPKFKDNLEFDKEYGKCHFRPYMREYLGKEVEIGETLDNCYKLKYLNFYVTDEMLEYSNNTFVNRKEDSKKYIIVFNRETSTDDDIILNLKQDVNRPNNATDDEVIQEYIYNNYGHSNYEAEELNTLEEYSV